MDDRLITILFPVAIAASWAFYNIGRVAIQQVKRLIQRS